MKKIILVSALIFIIPFMIVTLRIKDKKIVDEDMNIVSNTLVRVKRESKNKIETVSIEDYVIGVISGEMPVSFELEALKAQAICARTYVLRKIKTNKNKEYDVVDTISNQVYLDKEQLQKNWKTKFDDNYKKITDIVTATKGEYMTYNGEVIETFFFSTSNGKTENSEDVFVKALPYLRSVDSSWDTEISPVYSTLKEISLSDFYTKLNLKYNKNLKYEIIEKNDTGSIAKIKINGKEFKGTEIRSLLGLRSTYFEMEQIGSNVVFKNKGNGHGVGMSQYGANGMAKEGYKYDEILKHYYTGIEISKI